ncbi:MAG TPA: metalloregulator ArsR/SmtB family transcription factor [Acidimicrobiia bacterium]|nr:metalloregulator ArsR/SmtB family transcription factor [Acidimicrobiia bacterium]
MTDLEKRAAAFAALGDPYRLAIVDALQTTDLTPGDLARRTGLGTNHLAHHLRLLETAGLISRTRSEGDGRRRYVSLVPAAVPALGTPSRTGARAVAFVCSANSARSQFAQARYEQLTGLRASSAGTHPARSIHPDAVVTAREYGLDLSRRRPKGYTALGDVDTVISVCDRAVEHDLPDHRHHLHWSIPDPARPGTQTSFAAAFGLIDGRITRLLGIPR